MALGQIISRIRRKNSNGNYETFYLGPEQRYSSALPTSNNNNLEEQLLMGVDKIIKTWHDSVTNTDRKVIEFRRESDLNNYYILDISVTEEHFIYVENEVIHFEQGTGLRVDDGVLIQSTHDPDLYCNEGTETLVTHSIVGKEEHTLYYIKTDGTRLKVSSKLITKTTDENNVVTTKEEITNYL